MAETRSETTPGESAARRGDLEWATIPNLARHAAERYGDRVAVVDGDTEVTFGQLWEEGHQAAKGLVSLGVSPGDRVAIWCPNIWEWPVALIGIHAAGAVLVPLNTRYKGAEAAHILRASGAKVLVTVDSFLDNNYLAMLTGQDLPDLEHVVVLREATTGSGMLWDELMARPTDADGDEVDRRLAQLSAGDLADILFTSGTTGLPKGVMCTHGQNLRGSTDWADIVGLRASDRYLVVNPYFHSFGYRAGILACLATGATMVAQAVFDVGLAMRNIQTHRITAFPGAPTIYETILNHPDRGSFDLSSLRLAVTGAATIPVSLIRRMRDDLGFDTVVTAYGLSEATGFVSICRDGDDAETIATTSGRAFPGVEVKVVGSESDVSSATNELPRGEPGEIVVRGYNVMQGYFGDPEQTAQAIDADGWLRTGDIGVMDEQGNVRITDRKKDMFIVGGFNAYPAEIENLLLAHESIAQVAVLGVPDERLGEVGVAYVVPTHGHAPEPAEIHDWARQTMANFKVPRHVYVVDQLPVNAGGKVVKYQLRDQAMEQIASTSHAGENT